MVAGLVAWATLVILLALLYSRFKTRAEALAHEARQRILALVEQEPRTIAALAKELGVDRSTAQHHARVLARTGAAALRKEGKLVYVTLPGQAVPAKPLVPEGAPALLVELLRAAGGSLAREALHERAGELPHRTRNHVLRDLVERGVIERRFVGNEEHVVLARAA